MTRFITHSLWVRQTAYTVLVIAVVAIAITFFEMVSTYKDEHARTQDFGDQLIDTFYDATARAAFHVDQLQAESAIEGLMKFEEIHSVSIRTDLNSLLARRTRLTDAAAADPLAIWLFSDVASFQRELIIDRSNFVTGQQKTISGGMLTVGTIEIRLDPAVIGSTFVKDVRGRALDLAFEFAILGTALGFIFYVTITRPLVDVADRLGEINPNSLELGRLDPLKAHRNDEFGLVVDGINQLLGKIEEQNVDLVHKEKIGALGSMLAEVAHELNNPLAVVTAQAELLAETATDDRTRERAEKILRPAKRCADIVRKFLSLARRRKIEKSVVNLPDLINESVDMLKYQLDKRSIDVDIDIDVDPARIWGDEALLGQVLINILVNAQQALSSMGGGRHIRIDVHAGDTEENITISIADDGPGIPSAIRDKVFDHFFTTKPEGRGTGLGLAFCKSVIEEHGGTIVANNVEPSGADIVITLPTTTKIDSLLVPRATEDQSLDSLRVLVVDDEEQLASTIAEILRRNGHVPSTAFSCEQAIARLDNAKFDVILADIHMPGADGLEFYRRVVASDKSMAERFVFVTGDSLDPRLIEFFEEQRRPYINKPFELQELMTAIKVVMTKADGAGPIDAVPEAHTSG